MVPAEPYVCRYVLFFLKKEGNISATCLKILLSKHFKKKYGVLVLVAGERGMSSVLLCLSLVECCLK